MAEIKVLCDCTGMLYVTEEDLGTEAECGRCGSDMPIPETLELVKLHNESVRKADRDARSSGNYRIMIIDECGAEQCIHNNIPENLKDVVLAGVRAQYMEARAVFAEAEENYAYIIEQRRLDGDL